VYEPDEQFVGFDSFEYVVEDAGGHRVSATVWLEVIAFNDPTLASAQPGNNEFDETPVVDTQNSMQMQSAERSNAGLAYEQTNSATPDGVPDNVDNLKENEVSDTIVTQDIFAAPASVDNYHENIKPVEHLSLTRADVLAITSLLKDLLEYEVNSFDITFEIKEFEKTLSVNLQDAIVALREQIDEVLDKQVECRCGYLVAAIWITDLGYYHSYTTVAASRPSGDTGTPR